MNIEIAKFIIRYLRSKQVLQCELFPLAIKHYPEIMDKLDFRRLDVFLEDEILKGEYE